MTTLPREVSLGLYRTLYLARYCEEVIVRIYLDDEMKTPMHMSMGQEAVSVGICGALAGNGDVITSYRSHATYLAQAGDHRRFFGELHGRTNGTADGKSGSMHLADIPKGMLGASGIVGAGIPMALGAAFANQQQAPGRVVAVFFGDGAVDEGVFWESLNIACAMGLPVMFVCEDNDLAVHTRVTDRRGYASLAEIVRRYNCVVLEDESNDVEAIYRLGRSAIEQILSQKCPAFLNIRTYRYLEHCGTGPDTDAPYRKPAEDAFWKGRDCVAMQRNRLISAGVSEADIIKLERAIDADVEASVKIAKQSPHPDKASLYRGVFYETP